MACRLANREIPEAGVVSDFGIIGDDPGGWNLELGGQNHDSFYLSLDFLLEIWE